MPNPRANRPLTLDQVTADLKSFAQPAQALFDMMAGGLRGSAVGTFGAPGDIETLGRMGLNAAGGSFNPAMPSRSGRAFQPVSEEPFFPSSEELAKRFPPTIPNGDPVRRKSAEPFEELGQFAPLPMSGKALKVLPYALGRGTGEVTKEAARMVNDAMINQTGPLSQGPLSMLAPKGAVSHVVKPKGGNWLSGSAERAVKPLKSSTVAGQTPAERIPLHEELLKDPSLNQDQIDRVLYQLQATKGEAAVDDWIERNLTNYIKKEMATPEDPVRRLAEQGITHMPANELDFANAFLPEKLALKRMNAGFPAQGLGESPTAQGWERITDELMNVAPASEHTRPLTQAEIRQGVKSTTEADPWLNKVDPNTPIYYPENMDSLARDLGFDHIVDVLREDIATGRIRPEQLSKVSMEQAVRRTYEYDQELAKKMAEARASAREGLPVHKEYPEGYRWVELNRPGAFASESEAMGHSVRGYEPPKGHPDWAEGSGESGSSGYGHGGWEAIKSGEAKVYSLVDPKGEPHVTVEVGQMPLYEKKAAEMKRNGASNEEIAAFFENPPMAITQIKGKQNRAPKEEYLPFVQDFVKGGKWSDVGDLQNTGLVKYQGNIMTQAEADELLYQQLNKDTPGLTDELGLTTPPEDGMKHGGSVHISDNPDTMMMELGDKRMKGGGAEDDTKPFIGYPNLAKQARYSRAVAPERGDVNLLKDPQTYAFVMGALGEAPDELGFTVLDSDEQKQKIKAAGEKGFVTGAVSQLGPLAQLGKKAGKKILSLAGEGINERMLSGRSLTPFVDTPAPVMFAVPPGDKAAKSNLVIKSKPGMIVSNLIDEEPDIAKRLGAEARAKRQAAIEAEGQRKQLAAQTQPSVGYRPSTPQKPDPLVGTRFVNEPEFGLNPNEPFDIAKFKGGSGMVLPWDSQSRNVKTTQLSGVDLPNQIFDVTHGGIPYAFDTAHVNKGVAGASGLDIAKRVKTRADTAVSENIGRGGTGELLHFPITMGFRAEDYALPYSEFSFDIINHKLMTGELTQKEVDELTKMVRNFEPPKYKGKKPFAEFAGFTDPEGLNQIYTGEGLKVPPGELRKAIADRMIWQKGSQEKLGFNAEDLMNATTYEPLRGVDKGFIGSTVMRNSPGGMRLSPSAGKYPYDTDFSGEHLGRLEDLIDVEALFHRTLNPIKRELITRENLKPYNKESLRNAAIGAIEKRNEGISQPIDQQFLDDYADYLNEMKKPHEYRKGGAITAKRDGQKFKPGKKPDQILKHGQAMPRGKDPEVDIGQMAPMMMAGGGEVNADDLILEERPL
jgi:hypothetical protein